MIGILGGMGTQAGLDFCNKLAKLNKGKTDQQYPLFVLYNKSNIPGRPENLHKYNKVLKSLLTGIRVAVGMCWGTLVAAEFLAGTTGIGFVENIARKYMQYEVIWITIFVMGMLGLLFDITIRKIIDKTIPWRGKG